MPFDMPESKKSEFKKANYFVTELGTHYIRFLQLTKDAAKILQHYLAGPKVTVRCLGDDCPICANNRTLLAENPGKRYAEIKGLNFPSMYAHINILDRTPVKICPGCQHEVKADVTGKFPTICPHCMSATQQILLTGVQIISSEKVKVMSLAKGLAGQVDVQENGQLDTEGNPIPVTNYDFEVFVVPNGDKKNIFLKAHPERNDPIAVPAEMLYDVQSSVMKLNVDEIISSLKGTQLRDIFAARRTEVKEVVPKTVITSKEDVDRVVNELMYD